MADYSSLVLDYLAAVRRSLGRVFRRRTETWTGRDWLVLVAIPAFLAAIWIGAAFLIGRALTDGRHEIAFATLAAVLAASAVMSYRRWGWRWWWCLSLLSFGVTCLVLDNGNWRGLGFTFTAVALAVIVALNGVPATLRVFVLLVAVVAVVLLVRIGQRAREPEATGGDRQGRSLITTIDDGADRALTSAVGALTGEDRPLELGPEGWGVALVGLGLAYRQLEIVSARRLVGPVTVGEAFAVAPRTPGASGTGGESGEAAGGGAGVHGGDISRHIRDWLARADIAEPTTVPGMVTGQRLVDVASADPTKSAGAIASAVVAASQVLFPKTGIVASPTYEEDVDAPPEGRHVLTVTLKDARTEALLTAKTFRRPSLQDAVESASAFVAQYAVVRADIVPPWADWPDPDGKALARNRKARETSDLERKEAWLRDALAAHPASGVLKVALGHCVLMRGDQTEALRLYLDTRLAYPRFFVARYRLAASLAMAGDDRARTWCTMPEEVIGEVAQLLRDADLVNQNEQEALETRGDREPLAEILLRAAHDEAVAAQLLSSIPGLLGAALIWRRERQSDLHALFTRDLRRRYQLATETSRLLIQLRRQRCAARPDPARVRRLATRLDTVVARARRWTPVGAVALYNAACFFALRARFTFDSRDDEAGPFPGDPGDADKASELLAEIRRSFPNTVLTADWLRHDPDLRFLRSDRCAAHPRFARVMRAVEESERRVERTTPEGDGAAAGPPAASTSTPVPAA